MSCKEDALRKKKLLNWGKPVVLHFYGEKYLACSPARKKFLHGLNLSTSRLKNSDDFTVKNIGTSYKSNF